MSECMYFGRVTEQPPQVDAIIDALAALRMPRGRGEGPHRPGAHPRDGGDAGTGAHRVDGAGGHGRPGERRGGVALMRMLQALVSAPAPLSVSDVADAIGVDQPRASRLVQQAADRGLVAREADPADARRTRIAVTDGGRALVDRFRAQRREAASRALSSFTPAERDDLARLLVKLADAWPR